MLSLVQFQLHKIGAGGEDTIHWPRLVCFAGRLLRTAMESTIGSPTIGLIGRAAKHIDGGGG